MSTDPNLNNFVGLSSILTGYTQDQIAPEIDPIGLASEYLNWMLQHADRQAFLQTLTTYQNIASQFQPLDPVSPDPAQVEKMSALVQEQILSGEATGDIGRRIIRLWYLSTWYTTEPPDPNRDGQVVSMNAYTLGLAWDAAQAHPMGYSELHPGYWQSAPPANDVSPNSFPNVNVSESPAPGTEEAGEAGPRVALQRGGI
ncbi:MAG TPA: hypothetical protein VIF64_02700 [Pyrinomonadaceae bacterium]|jgi:hypothetical protein